MTEENPEVYYFGCWGDGPRGHAWYGPKRRPVHHTEYPLNGGSIDAALAPLVRTAGGRGEAPQGEASLHIMHSRRVWTVVSFWDRTGDKRPNSNSSFVVEGRRTFEQVVAISRAEFPELFARFTFEVKQHVPTGG